MRALNRLVPAIGALGLPLMAAGQALPADLFTAGADRAFGYTLGTVSYKTPPIARERHALPAEFAPFKEVELSWSQPSGTLYEILGSGHLRTERGCVEKLDEVRARFDTTHAVPLREVSFTSSDGDPYLGYYGTRERVSWRLACEGGTLSVSAIDSKYDRGCDPREKPAAPQLVPPSEWTERFPGLERSSSPEIGAVWQRIASRAESTYGGLLSTSPCLEAAIAVSVVLDSEGAVQAVASSSSELADDRLERRVEELVRTTVFPKDAVATWRLTTIALRFDLR